MKLSAYVAFTIFLTALASTADAQVLFRGNDGDPETLDHHGTSTISESRLMDDLYSGLVDFIQKDLPKILPKPLRLKLSPQK